MMRLIGPALRARSGDPHWDKVVLLLQDGSILDRSLHGRATGAINAGVTQDSTEWTYAGLKSVKLVCSSSREAVYFSGMPQMGTQDWTIEMAVRVVGNTGQDNFYPFYDAGGGNGAGLTLRGPPNSGSGMRRTMNGGASGGIGANKTFTDFEFYICTERVGRYLYHSYDGVVGGGALDLGSTSYSINAPTNTPGIGGPPSTAGTYTAYVAMYRATYGVARYGGADFTPPNGALPIG